MDVTGDKPMSYPAAYGHLFACVGIALRDLEDGRSDYALTVLRNAREQAISCGEREAESDRWAAA